MISDALSKFAYESSLNKFIITTEPGVIHQMERENSDKTFIPFLKNDRCSCNKYSDTLKHN